MRGLFAIVGGVLVLLGVGWLGYMMGASASVAVAGAPIAGAPVAYPVYGWGFPFFPFFGFIFFILFIFLVFGLIRRATWGDGRGMGYRGGWGSGPGWGPGPRGWDQRSMPPQADEMLQGWHRRAHGEPDAEPKEPNREQG